MIHIEKFSSIDAGQECRLGNHIWSIARLITLSKGLEIFEIPMRGLNTYNTYEKLTLRAFVMHMKCVQDADLSYPIILDEDGEIMDGRHRVMKAMLEGREKILAVRFDENPSPCRVKES